VAATEVSRADAGVLMLGGAPRSFEELLSRPDWQLDAACRYESTELFFPRRGSNSGPAKAICERCPVRDACRAWALGHPKVNDLLGVWGGLSAQDRRSILRRSPVRDGQKASSLAATNSTTQVASTV
jgi:WhiB family redox-sensing transcriptional regulator